MNEEEFKAAEEDKKNPLTSILVGGLGLFSIVYLFNPTLGVLELIPDNLPVVGNLDEAAAAALLISCLAYFGVDIGNLFKKKGDKAEGEKDVIDV